MKRLTPIFKFRAMMIFFITALALSGITAFPLLLELRLLAQFVDFLGMPLDSGLSTWIHRVHEGLEVTYRHYPWLAYGTDWLAFGHLVIAVFFIGPLVEPKTGRWTLITGLIACLGIFLLAFICGPIRGIPFFWRLIDCSFGFFGIFPLLYCLKLQREIMLEAVTE